MAWLIRVGDGEVSSDDFTIAELGEVEAAAGEPWSVANPLRSVKIARAFLAVALLRLGRTQDQTADELEALTLRTLKGAFVYVPDDDDEEPAPVGPTSRRGRTTRGSSPGARTTGGPPAKSAPSG